MIQKSVEFKGKHLFYRTNGNGQGPLVVLLHGFGEDGNVWTHQSDALPGFRLVVPDLPGSGQSQVTEDMSMEGLAEAVKQIIDTEGNNTASASPEGVKVILIGHSMGGYVSLAFAEKYPGLVKALGLFHSTAFADSEEKKATRRKGIDFIRKKGAFEFLKVATPNLYSSKTKESQPALIEEQVRAARNFTPEALIAYYEAMIRRPDRTNVLQQNKFPVLFVLGKEDTAVPLQDGLKQAHLPAISYIHILDQSGHMGMQEEPAKSNVLLLDFLSQQA